MGESIMSLDFKDKNIVHETTIKFTQAFLSNANKPFNLKAKKQPVLDINSITTRALLYNIATSPRVIEEVSKRGLNSNYYLVARAKLRSLTWEFVHRVNTAAMRQAFQIKKEMF